MSGRTKRILYTVIDGALYLLAFAGAVLLAVFAILDGMEQAVWATVGFLAAILLQIPVVLHEVGHLLFGAYAGMKFHSVTFLMFRIGKGGVKLVPRGERLVAGETVMFPKSGKHVRARLIAFAAGGSAVDLALGLAGILLYFLLPYHPALLFAAMVSAFLLYEGLSELLPANLTEGNTDGRVLFGLLSRDAEAEILLRVFTAQGILYRGSFRDLPEGLLTDVPVVREDLPASQSLMLLRAQSELARGEEDAASQTLGRLLSADGLLPQVKEEAERYRGVFDGSFSAGDEGEFRGVRELDAALENAVKTKKSADSADTKKDLP